MLHAPTGWSTREVIKKRVRVEWTIVHPGNCGINDLVKRGDDFVGVVVRRISVDDDAEVSTRFVEFEFVKKSNFDGRVDEAVVIVGVELEIRRRQHRRNVPFAGESTKE